MSKYRWFLVGYIFVMFAIWGARQGIYGGQETFVDLIIRFITSIVVVQACVVDARIIKKPILHIYQFIMLFTWPVTVPVYLIWSRRLRGVAIALALAGLLILVYILTFYITWNLIRG